MDEGNKVFNIKNEKEFLNDNLECILEQGDTMQRYLKGRQILMLLTIINILIEVVVCTVIMIGIGHYNSDLASKSLA